MWGTIYAPAAQVTMSGNAESGLSLVAKTVRLSGNAAASLTAGAGPAEVESSAILGAGQLKTGLLWVSIEQQSISADPQQLARIRDAIQTINQTFAPYGVALLEVDAAASNVADVRIIVGPTSPCGDQAQSILGCATAWGEITLIDGWNWYAGADQTIISPQQFDLQTIITHELGHAVAIEHSSDANSTMYPRLATGEVRRDFTAHDLAMLADERGSAEHESSSLMSALRVQWLDSQMMVQLSTHEKVEEQLQLAGDYQHPLLPADLLDDMFANWGRSESVRSDHHQSDPSEVKRFVTSNLLFSTTAATRRGRKPASLVVFSDELSVTPAAQEQPTQDEALLEVIAEWNGDSMLPGDTSG